MLHICFCVSIATEHSGLTVDRRKPQGNIEEAVEFLLGVCPTFRYTEPNTFAGELSIVVVQEQVKGFRLYLLRRLGVHVSR